MKEVFCILTPFDSSTCSTQLKEVIAQKRLIEDSQERPMHERPFISNSFNLSLNILYRHVSSSIHEVKTVDDNLLTETNGA